MAVSVAGLASAVKGRVVESGAPDYDESRALFNAMIDKRPAAIAYCADEADVAAALRYGVEHGLRIAVRGGGHNGAGLGSVDDGLVIDLSQLNQIEVDPGAKVARVQGGALLKDLLEATHQHGLTVPVGIIGTTGVGGLTLGGGIGHFSRGMGLTIDNLLAATVVLADGSVVQTDAEREPDLFWALRGGGGNFGIVTQFTFRCHPASTVLAGPVLYDIDDAADVMRWYREFVPAQPDELGIWYGLVTVPPGPPFPEEFHLRKTAAVVVTQVGEEESDALREARAFGTPLLDGVGPMPVPIWNTAFDAVYTPGDQWYWRGDFVEELSDDAIDVHLRFHETVPTWKSTMHMYSIDGAASRVGNDETAWGYRQAKWGQVVAGVDPDPANAEAITEWTRAYSDALKPYVLAGGYSNFAMDEPDRVRGMYGANYERLARVKAQYDPDNVFRVNQNIAPAA
ncbi:MAG TPA: FAD-binding oxidoreductase [Gaiellaceae bacterium]|nr:FAD-binding oxidoreductase [Gaiellaceae bacterium]